MTRRSLVLALALLLPALPAWAQTGQGAPKEATEPVMRQLEAFRRDDYDSAYTFASAEIKEQFDRPAFERMVRTGYPEIARSTFARIAASGVAPDGHAFVAVKIRGANGNSIEAVYELVLEDGQWKINGVASKPDPGLVYRNPLPSGERAALRAEPIAARRGLGE